VSASCIFRLRVHSSLPVRTVASWEQVTVDDRPFEFRIGYMHLFSIEFALAPVVCIVSRPILDGKWRLVETGLIQFFLIRPFSSEFLILLLTSDWCTCLTSLICSMH